MAEASDLWDEFFQNRILTPHIELFECENLEVKSFLRGRKNRRYLKRNPKMEALVRDVCSIIIQEHEKKQTNVDGMIYCMYSLVDSKVIPLYIGKAERIGRNGNLSANISDAMSKSGSLFARWGYGYAYHLGDLSAAVFGHERKPVPKYEKWANELFSDKESLQLKSQVYFWCEAWKQNLTGPWNEYGPTSLSFLEYQLIGIGSKMNPNILNAEGTNFRLNG